MIPPITHPMGRHWRQPDHSAWLFDDTHVVLPAADFEQLANYSWTNPSGLYPGKVWRGWCQNINGWVVAWYDVDPDPNFVQGRERIALVVP